MKNTKENEMTTTTQIKVQCQCRHNEMNRNHAVGTTPCHLRTKDFANRFWVVSDPTERHPYFYIVDSFKTETAAEKRRDVTKWYGYRVMVNPAMA